MNKSAGRRTRLKLVILALFIAAAAFAAFLPDARPVGASVSGPAPTFTNAPGETNCTVCHGDFPVNSGTGNISITGLPPNYSPGQEIPLTVTVSQSDAVIYGFSLTAIDAAGDKVGTYILPTENPPTLRIQQGFVNTSIRDYVSHTVNGVTPTIFGTKSWTFTWKAPTLRAGKVGFYAAGNAANSDNSPTGDRIYTTSSSTLSGSALSNFDADGLSDVAVFRPSSGVWYALNSTDGNFQAVQFGLDGDIIVPGDYDADGLTDRAVWRPSTGVWYVQKSTGGFIIVQFGSPGDIPVTGDYDGDLKSDIAVWRPSTGVWYILRSVDSTYDIRQFGIATDKPAQGDFDADGKTDLAVWRPSTGVWYIWRSTDAGFSIFAFGSDGDRPVQGDYDSDGKTDAAVFRPSDGVWHLLRSTAGYGAVQFGLSADVPVPADFDGDGKTDIAVFREGVWYILRSSDGSFTVALFGQAGDVPVPAGYIAD